MNSKTKRKRHLDVRHTIPIRKPRARMAHILENHNTPRQVTIRHTRRMGKDASIAGQFIGSETPRQLAQMLGIPLRTAQRWILRKHMPAAYGRLYRLLTTGQLGELYPAWAGFTIHNDKLTTDDGFEISINEVRALPFTHMALFEHRRAARQLEQHTQQQLAARQATALLSVSPADDEHSVGLSVHAADSTQDAGPPRS